MPDSFIPIAEENGLILTIGDWVISEACRQKNIWEKSGFLKDISIAINLSAYQINKKDFLFSLANQVNSLCCNNIGIELEITETAIMQNIDRAANMLNKIHDLGVSIAIDDFGIGYSSLSKLKALPVDTLKIDKSFVRDIAFDSNDEAIVKAIIGMAESLELNVIAEGIETEKQLNLLLQHNCTEGQGFHFSKPLPANEISDTFFA